MYARYMYKQAAHSLYAIGPHVDSDSDSDLDQCNNQIQGLSIQVAD